MSTLDSTRTQKHVSVQSAPASQRHDYPSDPYMPRSTRMSTSLFKLDSLADVDSEVHWQSFWDFSAAVLCFLLHPHGSSTFTLQVYNRGGAFAAIFAGIMALLGGPVLLYEVALGQCTLAHPVNAFRISPLAQGVGYGMLVCAFIMVVFENLTLGGAAMFAVLALATPHRLVNAQVLGVYQDGIPGDPGVPPVYKLYQSKVGTEHYLHNKGMGKFRYELMACLFASWVLLLISSTGTTVSYSKWLLVGVLLPLEVFVLWLMVTSLGERGGSEALRQFFGVTTLPDFEMVMLALIHALTSLAAGCGVLIRLASLARFPWPQNSWWAYGFALVVTAKEMLFAGLTAASLGANAATRNASLHTLLHMDITGLELKVLTVGLQFVSFSTVWGIWVFLLFWIAELYYSLLLFRWVVAGTRALPYIRNKRRIRMLLMVSGCVVFLVFGVFCCFRNTAGYCMSWDLQQPKWVLSVLCMLEIMAGVYCYGLKDLTMAFKEGMGYFPDIYTRVCWIILPVALLIAMLVSMNVAYERRLSLDRMTCARVDCLAGLVEMVIVLIPVALVALHNIRVHTLRRTLPALLKQRQQTSPSTRAPGSTRVHSATFGSLHPLLHPHADDEPHAVLSGQQSAKRPSEPRDEQNAKQRAEPPAGSRARREEQQMSPISKDSKISSDASEESSEEPSTSKP